MVIKLWLTTMQKNTKLFQFLCYGINPTNSFEQIISQNKLMKSKPIIVQYEAEAKNLDLEIFFHLLKLVKKPK